MSFMNFGVLAAAVLGHFCSLNATASPQPMSLAGEWRLALEESSTELATSPSAIPFTDSIALPGTTAAQGKAPVENFTPRMDKETMNRLRERHPFVGVAWYQREVTVPTDWEGQSIRLTLERVMWESSVWIDGEPLGESRRSLSVPHRYDLTDRLTPGSTHTIALRIDNRQIVPIGELGHAYTPLTQTLWNGVVGNIALEALPPHRIERLRIVAKPTGDLSVEAGGRFSPRQRLVVSVASDEAEKAEPIESQRRPSGKATPR